MFTVLTSRSTHDQNGFSSIIKMPESTTFLGVLPAFRNILAGNAPLPFGLVVLSIVPAVVQLLLGSISFIAEHTSTVVCQTIHDVPAEYISAYCKNAMYLKSELQREEGADDLTITLFASNINNGGASQASHSLWYVPYECYYFVMSAIILATPALLYKANNTVSMVHKLGFDLDTALKSSNSNRALDNERMLKAAADLHVYCSQFQIEWIPLCLAKYLPACCVIVFDYYMEIAVIRPWTYGLPWHFNYIADIEYAEQLFPLEAMCSLRNVGPSGNFQLRDTVCTIPHHPLIFNCFRLDRFLHYAMHLLSSVFLMMDILKIFAWLFFRILAASPVVIPKKATELASFACSPASQHLLSILQTVLLPTDFNNLYKRWLPINRKNY